MADVRYIPSYEKCNLLIPALKQYFKLGQRYKERKSLIVDLLPQFVKSDCAANRACVK
jgi:hypothetical protein